MILSQLGQAGGTLYMSIPCKDGLVLCADKRTRNINSYVRTSVDDSISKLNQIDKTVVFMTSGYCIVEKGYFNDETNERVEGKDEVLFNADSITRKFYRSNSPRNIEQNYELLSKKLKESYAQTIARLSEENLNVLTEPTPAGQHLFQTLFFANNRANGIRIYELTAKREGLQVPSLTFSFRQLPLDPFSIRPTAFGFFYVSKEIYQGNDSSFSELRERPIIKRLIMNYEDPATVSIGDALLLAKEIFEITYKRYRDVSSPCSETELEVSPISKTIDSAIITFDRGFQWLQRNLLVVCTEDELSVI